MFDPGPTPELWCKFEIVSTTASPAVEPRGRYMSAEIINLRQFRKARERAAKEAAAAENRSRFGKPRSERDLDRALDEQATRRHAGHRLTDNDRGKPDEPKKE